MEIIYQDQQTITIYFNPLEIVKIKEVFDWCNENLTKCIYQPNITYCGGSTYAINIIELSKNNMLAFVLRWKE